MGPSPPIRPHHPYARAPRVPDEGPLDLRALCTRAGQPAPTGPVEIEIGPGRGGFVFERAAVRPERFVLGFEIRMKWATLVDERLVAQGLGARGRVYAADAKDVFARLGPDASVAVVYLHFPDPWWKKRHEKRLVVGDGLVADIARVLVDGGELFVQTDVEERAALYAEVIGACEALEPAGDEPGSPRLAESPYEARSPREHHAIRDGLPVERLRWRRRVRDAATRS